MDNKLKIRESGHSLSIEYKWMSPRAYFLVFFCLIWDGFLVFWYGIAFTTDGDLMMKLFPLIHVAVGVGLTYYTICLFINKTNIEVDHSHVSIVHSPLPWWKGNKEIAAKDIEQLYVKEKVSSSDNGSKTHYYTIRSKMKNGKDETLIGSIGMESFEAVQIEQKIESFLRIPDYAVQGEYGVPNKRLAEEVKQRRTVQTTDTSTLQGLRLGSFLDFESNSFKVAHMTQFDWKNGDTDRFFQLQSIGPDKDRLLHISQQKGSIHVFLEAQISLLESRAFLFSPANPPATLKYQDHDFDLVKQASGTMYLNESNTGSPAEQWTYESGMRYHIRVVSNDGMLEYFIGERELEGSFYKILNP